MSSFADSGAPPSCSNAVPLCVPVLPELGYTTPALDLEPEAEASNADFTTSGKTCWLEASLFHLEDERLGETF